MMKEAAGEANMTVITIVLIAIVLAVGTVVVNNIMKNVSKSSNCESAGGTWTRGECRTGCTQSNNNQLNCSGSLTLQEDGSFK